MKRLLALLSASVCALGPAVAGAQPSQPTQEPGPVGIPPPPAEEDSPPPTDPGQPASVTSDAPTEQPLTAADVANAPRPGAEHGRVDPIDTGDGAGRVLGRIILWIPRIPVEIVMQPIRGFLYAQEKYNVADKVKAVFLSEDGKLGLYPTAFTETGFGLNIGARAFVRDLFGQDEKLALRVGFGGRLNRILGFDFDTGNRAGPFSAGIDARYENRDRDRFFGYGNGDNINPAELDGMLVDPLAPGAPSVSTRYKLDIWRVTPRVAFRFPHRLRLQLAGGLVHKEFGVTENARGTDVPLEEAYQISGNALPSFVRGTTYGYGELELSYDSRRPYDEYDAPGIAGTGGLAMGFFGRQHGVKADEPAFFRMGVDLQRYFRLTAGPRVLSLRAYGEMVTGQRDEIPFSELPRLGGPDLLRGYSTDRFRDRVITVVQANYLFLIGRQLAGDLFVDAGRVHQSLSKVSLDDMRVGFGIALEAYSVSGLLVRAALTSSIDRDLFFIFSFNPVFNARSRVERY